MKNLYRKMLNVFEYNGAIPQVDESSYVHPQALLSGDVVIGPDVYIGAGTTIRGEFGKVEIGKGSIILDNCTITASPVAEVKIGNNAFIKYGVVVYGALVGANVTIDTNSVVSENAVIGESSIVGALCFIPPSAVFESRRVLVGNPARTGKQVNEEMLAKIDETRNKYAQILFNLKKVSYAKIG